ncbi:MAG: CHAT domain-containing protein [Acidobacteriota bacterium]
MSNTRDPFRRGLEHRNARRFGQAHRALREAVELGLALPWSAQELVRVHLTRGTVDEAEVELRRLLPDGSPELAHALGYLHRRCGRRDDARRFFEAAADRKPRYWPACTELGWLLHQSGEAREGRRLLNAARRRFETTGDDWGLGMALVHLATLARVELRLTEARKLFALAVPVKERCGDLIGLATAHYGLAQVRHFRAEYRLARESYEQALALQRQVGFDTGIAASLNGLGVLHLELSDWEQALPIFREAVRRCRRLGSAADLTRAHALVNLALAQQELGRTRSAIGNLELARSLTRELPSAEDEDAQFAARLAHVLRRNGRAEEALAVLDDLELDRLAPLTRHVVSYERSAVLLRLDQLAGARTAAQQALDDLRGQRGADLRVEREWARARLGTVLVADGESRRGLAELARAARATRTLIREEPVRPFRLRLLEALHDIEDQRVLALAREGRARQAWEVSSITKATELRERLDRSLALAAADDETLDRLLAIELELRQLTAGTVERRDQAQLATLRDRHRRLTERLRTPARDEDDIPPMPTLSAGHALLEYHVSADTTLLFVKTSDEVVVHDLALPERRLRRDLQRLLEPLRAAATSRNPQAQLLAFDVHLAHALHRRLVAPALRRSPDLSRAWIVPDGPLHGLPFEILVSRPPSSRPGPPMSTVVGQTHLADELTFSYLPSSRLPSREHRRGRRRSLVFEFSPETTRSVLLPEGVRRVRPLTHLASEAEAIARVLPNTHRLRGRGATVEAFRREASRASVLHVAAHAFADTRLPELSGIVVSGVDEVGDGEEPLDFLTAADISRLPMKAELVTLSGCETAFGRTWRREGTLGVARAFQEAGAETVLATSWPVDDAAMTVLMTGFHRRFAESGDAAASLREARLELRERGGPDAHPFSWAGVVLTERRVRGDSPAASRAPA